MNNVFRTAWDETRAEISALHGRGLVNGDDLEVRDSVYFAVDFNMCSYEQAMTSRS